jgi:hypothetical protein
MRRGFLTFALAASLMASPAAFAQEGAYGPDANDWEITLSGGGTNDNDFTQSQFNADVNLGRYLTRNWLVSVQQGLSYSDVGGSSWNGSSRVGADYHFDMGEVRPYVGANVGYLYGDNTNDTWIAAGQGGLKWYVKQETFIFGEAEYQWLFDETNQAANNIDDGRIVYNLGIGFNF